MESHFARLDTVAYFKMVGSKLVKDAYNLYRQEESHTASKVRKENSAEADAPFSEQLLFVLKTWNDKFHADIIVEEVSICVFVEVTELFLLKHHLLICHFFPPANSVGR